MSGSVEGGWGSGRLNNLIGDSHAGKSILALTGMAEMAHDPKFDDYLLIYYDKEQANAFDYEKSFGRKTLERLEQAWEVEKDMLNIDEYIPPISVQDWYQRMLLHLDKGHHFYAVLDSFDSICPEEELARAYEIRDTGKTKGSFKTEKPRWASEIFRVISDGLSTTQSGLTIISQTRANLEPIGFQKVTRSGGKALEFYSSAIVWLTKLSALSKTVGSKKLSIGRNVQAHITKTKLTGWEGKVAFPILRQIGVDDVGGMIDFCVEWGDKWKKSGNRISCDELEIKGYRMDACRKAEEKCYKELKQHMQEAWDAYMEEAKIDRLPRFK